MLAKALATCFSLPRNRQPRLYWRAGRLPTKAGVATLQS